MIYTRYNIIGDVHGRDVWKRLVDDGCINVFLGDFFDPYSRRTTFEECKRNFLELIDYKRRHPETVLLWGNHELHYLLQDEISERYSRFDFANAEEIRRLLEENGEYFSDIAYNIGEEYLVSHAGVSRYWYRRWFGTFEWQNLAMVAGEINNLWRLNRKAFSVEENGRFPYDQDGETQSPLWVRLWVLEKCNLFEGTSVKQVFGHTQCKTKWERNGLICIDCLGGDEANCVSLKI